MSQSRTADPELAEEFRMSRRPSRLSSNKYGLPARLRMGAKAGLPVAISQRRISELTSLCQSSPSVASRLPSPENDAPVTSLSWRERVQDLPRAGIQDAQVRPTVSHRDLAARGVKSGPGNTPQLAPTAKPLRDLWPRPGAGGSFPDNRTSSYPRTTRRSPGRRA